MLWFWCALTTKLLKTWMLENGIVHQEYPVTTPTGGVREQCYYYYDCRQRRYNASCPVSAGGNSRIRIVLYVIFLVVSH